MTRAFSWNVEGIGFDAREAAKAAARRAGMSLGEWLNSLIADRAAELGVSADEIDDDQRLEAVAARLATLSKSCDQDALSGSRRVPTDAEFAGLQRARAVYDRNDRRSRVAIDPDLLLDRAIATFDRRAKLANDRTSAALAKVSQRLGEIEDRLGHGSQPHGPLPAKEVLSRLETRLEGVARRLEQVTAKAPSADPPADRRRAEGKLNQLSETIDRAGPPQAHSGRQPGALAPRSVADAIAEITQRQGVLDHGARPATALDRFDTLQADLAALATRLEETRRDIVERDEQQFRTISEKIETLGQARSDVAALARIRAQTEEIRNLLTTAVAHPLPIENIEGQITALAERLEALTARSLSPSTHAAADADLAEIRAALTRPVADPRLQQIEDRIESLVQKVEEVLSHSAASEHFDELRQRMDFIHQSLAARIDQPTPSLDPAVFEAMMREIADKLDHPPQAAIDALEIERLMSRVVDRLEAPTETHRLEELLLELADKVDAAVHQHADLPTLAALQDQVARLVQRLDDPDANAGAVGSLESSIADLFAELEATRRAAVEAAETAARSAARDTAREVVAQAAGLRPAADEQADNVTREIADLRALQGAADRQTHATLIAVHETLERVVDRLAMLEDDIIDVRGAALGSSSDHGAPPSGAKSPEFASTSPTKSDRSQGQEEVAPVLDDRDFLIEPGTGFSPERRSGDPERRGPKNPPRPPSSPDSKPPTASPPAPSVSPPASSTQANFIAAARRTIHVNAMGSAETSANARTSAASLGSMLAEAASRAKAAPGGDDRVKPANNMGRQSRGGVLSRASAFFAARKRPLVLGFAAIIIMFCALELARTEASAPAFVASERGLAKPNQKAPRHAVERASPVPLTREPSAPVPSSDPTTTGSVRQTRASSVKTSAFVAPDVDFSPVGSIGTSPAPLSADGGPNGLTAIRNLASSGNAEAELELGLRYAEGRGLTRDLPLAAQWLQKAARQNNAPAEYRLATLYEKGLGVARDTMVALNWYRRAARAGNIRAMHNLAVMIAEGADGKPDYDEAAIWFRKAADYGVRDSQYNLAILYARGLGVDKDFEQSYIWFALAAAHGDADAAKKRDAVAAYLDAKQLADARIVIKGFVPHKPLESANNVAPLSNGAWGISTVLPTLAKPMPNAASLMAAKVSAL